MAITFDDDYEHVRPAPVAPTDAAVPVTITLTIPAEQYAVGYSSDPAILRDYLRARLETMPDEDGGESTPTVAAVVISSARLFALSDEAIAYVASLVRIDGGENTTDAVAAEVAVAFPEKPYRW